MKLKLWIIILFAFNFLLANAENYTIHNENQTLQISIKPNIVVEPQNLTKLNAIVEKLTNKPDWTAGDVIISSSTIVAFFTFGSFLVLRFEGENKGEKYEAMRIVLMSVALIQIMHLGIIAGIIINSSTASLYPLVVFLTIILILRILYSVLYIHDLTKNEEEKKGIKTDDVIPLIGMLKSAEDQRDDARRELKKTKQEGGY